MTIPMGPTMMSAVRLVTTAGFSPVAPGIRPSLQHCCCGNAVRSDRQDLIFRAKLL